MSTYKIGNKVTAIIRAYSSGQIGDFNITYKNQPYTVLKDVEISIDFDSIDTQPKSRFVDMAYSNSRISSVTLSNILITDKILNLIYSKSETKYYTSIQNCDSIDNKIYLNFTTDKIYQVFVYNTNQELVGAYAELQDGDAISVPAEGNYLVCYQYEGQIAYSLDTTDNQYYTIDFIITGNQNDTTNKMNIHIEKCNIKTSNNMIFNRLSNTIDLTLNVIDTKSNYIVVK